jgi:hypothetical protein
MATEEDGDGAGFVHQEPPTITVVIRVHCTGCGLPCDTASRAGRFVVLLERRPPSSVTHSEGGTR